MGCAVPGEQGVPAPLYQAGSGRPAPNGPIGAILCAGMDETEIRRWLEQLRTEHRDLDQVIARLAQDPSMDRLQLQRLKKRKLYLKDSIARLESRLIPDLDA